MIAGIGHDIIAVERIQQLLTKHGEKFLQKYFTDKERAYFQKHREPSRNVAGRFAAKEAVVKALGTGFREGIGWQDIEVLNDSQGKPHVYLSERLQGNFANPQLHITISHCHEYASAVVIWEK